MEHTRQLVRFCVRCRRRSLLPLYVIFAVAAWWSRRDDTDTLLPTIYAQF